VINARKSRAKRRTRRLLGCGLDADQ
jgi:hypothetical protein